MINVHELRLGNWVNIWGEPNNIGSLQSNFWGVFINKVGEVDFKDISPIPLTPEILEKCGFVLMEGSWYNLLYIDPVGAGRFKCLYSVPYLDYLHQLQNLYFALTGKELEINL
jgi:hypothetical protein